jgi:hypothetical protein
MKTDYTDVRDDPELFAFAKDATSEFEKFLEGSGKDLEIKWRKSTPVIGTSSSGSPVFLELTMHVPDSTSGNRLLFPAKLHQNLPAVRTLLLRAWGDILQRRSHSLLEKLQKVD